MGDDFWTAHFNSEAVVFPTLLNALLSEFHADGIHSDDADLPLRFCMGLNPRGESDKEQLVTRKIFNIFLRRFGPIEVCVRRSAHGIFRDGLPAKWFHPGIGRGEAEALLCNNPPGSFLVRYSRTAKDALCISHNLELNDDDLAPRKPFFRHVLFWLHGDRGYTLQTPSPRLPGNDGPASPTVTKSSDSPMSVSERSPTDDITCSNLDMTEKIWESVSEFINEYPCFFIHPIESNLSTLFLAEVKLGRKWREFGAAQELAAHGEAEAALAKTDRLLECSDDVDVCLWPGAKVYLLRGDILASLGNETAAMMSYRDVVRVGEERVKQAALNVNGDSVLRQYCPVLSKSHKCLASYYLRNEEETTIIKGGGRRIPLGLLHCSLDIAYTTETMARRKVRGSWSTHTAFQSILDKQGWTPESAAKLQSDVIAEWRVGNLESAREILGEGLVQARCLGLDLLETKLLSNFAAINIMYGRPSEAVSQYLICLQILRGHRDAETYKKVLNFLVITLMRECTWNVAQKYNDELIALSESKEDLKMLMARREQLMHPKSPTYTQKSVR
eukprot:413540_1